MFKPMKLVAFMLACSASFSVTAEEKSVAITQIVEHPALDSVRLGVKEELIEQGFVEGENLKWQYESAQGNPTTAAQIARKFAGESPDVIVAIATPSAQTAAAAARNTAIVFSAVTDPVGAKLVKNLDKPGKNITGTTDMLPVKKHLELVKRLVPGIKTVGTIYNPGEANSVTIVELVEQTAPELDIKVIKAAATKSSDVLTAARSLVGKVDAIYLPTDNTVISAAEAVIKVGEQNNLPVIAADTDTVKRGAIAALGFNYYDVGRQTGAMVALILNGKKPGDIPVQGVEKMELYINPGAAERMGLELPTGILEEAKEVIK
ncbi:ABC transporter substrate-binding protein [Alkalimarinus sediminis]|uniref:ABC transporter substrate-binding protein n=1 Tax=Alkalimarinus sediminis TaxID=1632866 RepID=A0A9E8KQH5_9ALTE|nr:ABC transporter substrate-binding protein [Alkalimarinus sediminis]UZW75859.1 ABC transporter substrate-binding protein [Alkalimarinus sediminis]